MTQQERDPETVAFERAVRHDATVARIREIYRLRALRGSARSWRAIRALLRERRQDK